MRREAATLLVGLSLVLVACGGDGAADTTQPSDSQTTQGATDDVVRVGMALAAPRNDQGFAQAHYEGIVRAEDELGVEISVQEDIRGEQPTVEALRDLAQDNDLVIGAGADFAAAAVVVAEQFPDVQFSIVNGEDSDAPNLAVYGIREGIPAYIAGVLAAELSETGNVGFIGGEEIPPLFQSDAGFAAGYADGGGTTEPASAIVGDFTDVEGAYSATTAQLAGGADVIYGYLDAGYAGVAEAIADADSDALAFGIIFLRCEQFPNVTVGGSVLSAQDLVITIIESFLAGESPTEPLFFGVEDPSVQRFELCPDFATDELQQIVDETVAGINDGSIELPEGV